MQETDKQLLNHMRGEHEEVRVRLTTDVSGEWAPAARRPPGKQLCSLTEKITLRPTQLCRNSHFFNVV